MSQKVQIDAALAENLPSAHSFLLGTASPQRILYCVDHPPPPLGLSPPAWAADVARSLRPVCVGNLHILGLFVTPSANQTATAAVDAAAATARRVNPARALVLTAAARGRPILKDVSDLADVRPADLRTVPGLAASLVVVRATVPLPTITLNLALRETAPNYAVTTAAANIERRCVNEIAALVRRMVVSLRVDDKPLSVLRTDDGRALAELLSWPVHTPAKKKGSSKTASRNQTIAPLDLDVHFPVGQPCDDDDDEDECFNDSDRNDDAVEGEGEEEEEVEEDEEEDAILPKIPPRRRLSAVELSGTVCVRAVVTRHSDAGELLRAVRDDLLRTLRARLDMLAADDAERKDSGENGGLPQAAADAPPGSVPGARPFPARVIAAPGEGAKLGVPLSEYVMSDETIEDDAAERLLEVLSFEPADLECFTMERVEELATVMQVAQDEDKDTIVEKDESEAAPVRSLDEAVDIQEQIVSIGLSLAVALTIIAIIVKQFL